MKKCWTSLAIILVLVSISCVRAQSNITIYVDPSNAMSGIPCGMNSTTTCPNVTAAYMSIRFFSNSFQDTVSILLSPGIRHAVCGLSYFGLVANSSNVYPSKVTLQSTNESIANIECSDPAYSNLLSLDVSGISWKMRDINISALVSGMAGIQFSSSTNNITSMTFSCYNCIFVGTSRKGSAIALYDANKPKVSLNMTLDSCSFTLFNIGVDVRDTENGVGGFSQNTGLPCKLLINNCSFDSLITGATFGSNVFVFFISSKFGSIMNWFIYARYWGSFNVSHCSFNSSAGIEIARSVVTFDDCLLTDVSNLFMKEGYLWLFKNCFFQYTGPISNGLINFIYNSGSNNVFQVFQCYFSKHFCFKTTAFVVVVATITSSIASIH
jgi:hypothetical protein